VNLNLIFVYGILKGRYANAQKAQVNGYRLCDMGHFPAAIPADKGTIIGELITVDNKTVEEFDMIEGHPDFYVRSDVEVETDEGDQIELHEAQMYIVSEGYHKHDSEPTKSLTIKEKDGATLYEYHC